MTEKSPDPVPPLEAHLGYWLRRVSNPVAAAFTRALLERQTSGAEWVALRLLYDRGEATPGELAELMGMTKGAITKVIDRLERKAWVTRGAYPPDARVRTLTLTREGEGVLPELAHLADRNDAEMFGVLTTQEQAALRTLLEKVARAHGWSGVPVD